MRARKRKNASPWKKRGQLEGNTQSHKKEMHTERKLKTKTKSEREILFLLHAGGQLEFSHVFLFLYFPPKLPFLFTVSKNSATMRV